MPLPKLQKSPISNTTWFLMFGTAMLYYLIGLIPVVDILVDVVYVLTFWFWFTLHGIKFNSLNKIATMGVTALIEAIPVVSAIPAIPLSIVVMYFITRLPPEVIKVATAGAGTGPVTGSAKAAEEENSPEIAGRIGPGVRSVDGIRRAA